MITREWLRSQDPCVDGHAWGHDYLGKDGRPEAEALRAIPRADWLLWYAVKLGRLTPSEAVRSAWAGFRIYGPGEVFHDFLRGLDAALSRRDFPAVLEGKLQAARNALKDPLQWRREAWNALAFLAWGSLPAASGDKRLECAQCAVNSLVKSAGPNRDVTEAAIRAMVLEALILKAEEAPRPA